MITGVIQRMLKVLGVLGLLWSWQGTECYVLVSCLRPLHGIMNNKILFIMLSSCFGWRVRLWCYVFCRDHNKLRSSMTINIPCTTSAINPHDTIQHLGENPPYKTYKCSSFHWVPPRGIIHLARKSRCVSLYRCF